MSQVGQLNTLFLLAQTLSQATWGPDGGFLPLPGAVCKETTHFYKHSAGYTLSTHTLASGIWKLGQGAWGNLLGMDRRARGGAGNPRPTGPGSGLQGRLPWFWQRYLST